MSYFNDLANPGHLVSRTEFFGIRNRAPQTPHNREEWHPYSRRPQAARCPCAHLHSTYLHWVSLYWYGNFDTRRKTTVLYSISVFSTLLLFIIHQVSTAGGGGASLLSLAVGAQPPSILPTPKGSATNGKTENNCCVAVICDLCWQRPLFECRSTYLTTRFRAQQPTIVPQNSSTYLVSLMSYLGNINVQSKK
jgi:hypothetical protein